jgi:dihydrofolate reductase
MKEAAMGEVIASITTSVDGYYTGPDDGPGHGLGTDGERLHYWVFGGPWTYDDGPRGEATAEDRSFLEESGERTGAVIAGRGTYEGAGAWGGTNPFGVPLLVVTHRPEEQPDAEAGFTFVDSLEAAIDRAQDAAGEKDVSVMGGGDVIRQALAAGMVDELTVIVAPVVLGAGKRLFDGFTPSLDLEHVGLRQSQYATFLTYRVIDRGGRRGSRASG